MAFINEIKTTFSKLRQLFFLWKSNPNKIIRNVFAIILVFFISAESGYAYIKNIASSRVRMIALIITAFLILILYLSSIDLNKFQAFLRERKIPKPSAAAVFAVLFSTLIVVSFILSSDKSSSVYGYLECLCTIWCITLFCKSIDLSKFISIYVRVIFIISIFSLIFFFLVHVANVPFPSSTILRGNYVISNYFYLYFDFGDSFSSLAATSANRLMGFFWEPGVFGTHLLAAIFLCGVIPKRKNFVQLFIFIVCLILTKSLGSLMILPLILFLVIWRLPKTSKQRKVLLATYVPITLVFAGVLMFIFREKLFSSNSSLFTRVNSFVLFFRVFLEKPFFGFGSTLGNQRYFEISPSLIDSSTSSSGFALATFGVFGILFTLIPIIGFWKIKTFDAVTKAITSIIFIIAFNKENQMAIYSILFLYFLPAFKNLKFSWEFENKTSLDSSLIGGLFLNNKTSATSNISWSMVVRILALAVGLVTVPIFNNYFGNDVNYGAWLIIISVLTWILQFDFGLSNGLRTKFAGSYRTENWPLCKSYLKSTYNISTIFGILIAIVGSVLAYTLDWNLVYNVGTDIIDSNALALTMMIVFLSVAIEFGLRPIKSTMDAVGKSALSASLSLISNSMLLFLAVVFSISNIGGNRFILLAIAYLICINSPLVIATISMFRNELCLCKPTKKDPILPSSTKSLLALNVVFFVIQICNLVLYGFNDIIISKLFGPEFVTDYNKYYKLFSTLVTVYTSVFQAPIWVAVSAAISDKNFIKVKSLQKVTLILSSLFSVFAILLTVLLPFIFQVWLGENAPQFSWLIAIVFLLDALVRIWLCAFTLIGNGLGAVKSQCIFSVVAAILKIPLLLLAKQFSLAPELSFSIVVLSNPVVMWLAIVALPFEIRNKIRKIKKGDKTNENATKIS